MGLTYCMGPEKTRMELLCWMTTHPPEAGSTVPTGNCPSPIQGSELQRTHRREFLLTRPFRAAIMTSRSSPVAWSSSVGTPPPDAMERTAATALTPRALRASATRALAPQSNLEAITPSARPALPEQAPETGGTSGRGSFLLGVSLPLPSGPASAPTRESVLD